MTSISSVSGSSAWSSMSTQRTQRHAPSPERLLQKVDTDQSGGVDSTELQGLLDKVAEKTGTSLNASDTLKQFDTDGNGQLGADELGKAMESIMPAPSTMEFAQRHTSDTQSAQGQAGDDLFGKVDSDGSGAVSKTELQALLETMSGGTASQTGVSSDDLFAKLDTNGDGSLTQTEFDAGRPDASQGTQNSQGTQGGSGVHGGGGMPPPPPAGAGGASASSSSGSSSTTYDPLDTNEDGVVSLAERLAGQTSSVEQDAVTALFNAIDTDGDKKISDSESSAFIQALTSGMNALTSSSSATASTSASNSSSSGNASTSSSDSPRGELLHLAELARQRYEETAAAGQTSTTSAHAVSALA